MEQRGEVSTWYMDLVDDVAAWCYARVGKEAKDDTEAVDNFKLDVLKSMAKIAQATGRK